MANESIVDRLDKLHVERMTLLEKLVVPAQAASNALQDAGMKKTADPLAEALFSVDVNSQATQALISEDPQRFATEFLARLKATRE